MTFCTVTFRGLNFFESFPCLPTLPLLPSYQPSFYQVYAVQYQHTSTNSLQSSSLSSTPYPNVIFWTAVGRILCCLLTVNFSTRPLSAADLDCQPILSTIKIPDPGCNVCFFQRNNIRAMDKKYQEERDGRKRSRR